MKRLLGIALPLMLSLTLVSCGGGEQGNSKKISSAKTPVASSTNKITKESDVSKIKENIKVTTAPTLDDRYVAFIKNTNDFVIDDLEIEILFYDTSGSLIDTYSDGHDVILPGYTVVSEFDAPKNIGRVETKLKINPDYSSDYENHSDKVDIKLTTGNECEIVQVTNNADVTIDEIEYILVYYLGNDIAHVSYPEDIYDLASGDTTTKKDSTYDLKYDRCEVYLNQAHTFNL